MPRPAFPLACWIGALLVVLGACADAVVAQPSRFGLQVRTTARGSDAGGLKTWAYTPEVVSPAVPPSANPAYTRWQPAFADSLREDGPDAPTRVRPWRVAAIGAGATTVALAAMVSQQRRWWDERTRFKVQNDWGYVLGSDKFGHFFSSSFLARFYRSAFVWAGLSEAHAGHWGAGTAYASMLYYETLDGFGPAWGFDFTDLLFNTLGIGFQYAQWHWEPLEAFALKASYWPSGWITRTGEGKNPLDDYPGHTWWVTANPHHLGASRFPPWLNLAVGYKATEPDELDYLTVPNLYVGVDWEIAGLPIDHPVWNAAVPWLRYLHLPAPAIRLTPRPKLVLAY